MKTLCNDCGWEGVPEEVNACPVCFATLFCPKGCGDPNSEHGLHWYHKGKCSYHYGPCENPVWCECVV